MIIIAVQEHLLSVTSLPEILFNNESQLIISNSMVWLYCKVTNFESLSTLTVTWYKNDVSLFHDVPHLRLRNYTSNGVFRLALIVEDFQDFDNGVYHCIAEEGSSRVIGKWLTLTG